MNITKSAQAPADLVVVAALAGLLGRLEGSTVAVSPDQYRDVVVRLSQALEAAAGHAGLPAVLDAHPAATQVYENLQYQHAGLCRSALDSALSAEMRAVAAIDKARRAAQAG